MRTETVTCDGCSADLTTRTNVEDYRLLLAPESKPGYGPGMYTMMGVQSPISRPHHFCGLSCLDRWRDHEKLRLSIIKEQGAAWVETHGKKSPGITVWPTVPDDVKAKWMADAKTIADREFPLARPSPPLPETEGKK